MPMGYPFFVLTIRRGWALLVVFLHSSICKNTHDCTDIYTCALIFRYCLILSIAAEVCCSWGLLQLATMKVGRGQSSLQSIVTALGQIALVYN